MREASIATTDSSPVPFSFSSNTPLTSDCPSPKQLKELQQGRRPKAAKTGARIGGMNDRRPLGEEGRHRRIVDGEDGDGLAAIDLLGEVGDGEVVVEGGEFGVFGQYARDVVGGGSGNEEKEEEDRERELARHAGGSSMREIPQARRRTKGTEWAAN